MTRGGVGSIRVTQCDLEPVAGRRSPPEVGRSVSRAAPGSRDPGPWHAQHGDRGRRELRTGLLQCVAVSLTGKHQHQLLHAGVVPDGHQRPHPCGDLLYDARQLVRARPVRDAEIVGERGLGLSQHVGGDRPGGLLRPVAHLPAPALQHPPGLGEPCAGDRDRRAVGVPEQQHPYSQRIGPRRGELVQKTRSEERGSARDIPVRGCRALTWPTSTWTPPTPS